MAIPLLYRDDFAADAARVRQAVLDGGFTTEQGPDGAAYSGISQYPAPAHWFESIAAVAGAPITPRLSCFRLNLGGELPHSWVHSDDICARFASVLYLNLPEQCAGGTAFWKHRALNLERLPPPEELVASGFDVDAFYSLITREWKHLPAWQQIGFMPMQFNRFITYPTSYFHSRYPFDAFGDSPANGRLIWVCFYDINDKDQ
jgi:Family of unknown function (DUF6445)